MSNLPDKIAPFFREPSQDSTAQIRQSLLDNYYATKSLDLQTDAGMNDLESHVISRYRFNCNRWIPWVSNFVDVQNAHVVEIGAGTGASTCAFGAVAARVNGFDIDGPSTMVARDRAHALELQNTRHHFGAPDEIAGLVAEHADGPVDIVSLYATLEHQTHEERQFSLALAWDILREGGVVVIGQTPNLLSYYHPHTSQLPFFDMLPDWVKFKYLDHMPDNRFRHEMTQSRNDPSRDTALELTRWGRGMSFHEFEIAYGQYGRLSDLVVGHGFEQEILQFNPIEPEEKLLMTFFAERGLDVPIAFTRRWLTLVIRKPRPGAPAPKPLFDIDLINSLLRH